MVISFHWKVNLYISWLLSRGYSSLYWRKNDDPKRNSCPLPICLNGFVVMISTSLCSVLLFVQLLFVQRNDICLHLSRTGTENVDCIDFHETQNNLSTYCACCCGCMHFVWLFLHIILFAITSMYALPDCFRPLFLFIFHVFGRTTGVWYRWLGFRNVARCSCLEPSKIATLPNG